MYANGGTKAINQEGDWNGYGREYYLPDALMNIISLSNVVIKGFCMFMDSKSDNVFYVTDKAGNTVQFPCNQELYMKEYPKENHKGLIKVIEGCTPQ